MIRNAIAVLMFTTSFSVAASERVMCTQPFDSNILAHNPANQSALKLMSKPRFVSLRVDHIDEVAIRLAQMTELKSPKWNFSPVYPQFQGPTRLASFFLVINSINYSFFDIKTKQRFQDRKSYGSSLMTERVTSKWREIEAENFKYLRTMTSHRLTQDLFPAEFPISMVKERVAALREAGTFLSLLANEGGFYQWLKKRSRSGALNLCRELVLVLPSWQDEFLKRAQLFVAMLWGRFQGTPYTFVSKDSLLQLTIFADYRVAQTLYGLSLLEFDFALQRKLLSSEAIRKGSRMEREMRAASIVLGEKLRLALEQIMKRSVTAPEIDYVLWVVPKNPELKEILTREMLPHHFTRTTDY